MVDGWGDRLFEWSSSRWLEQHQFVGAGGASRGTHIYEYEFGALLIPRTDSQSRRFFGGNNAVSKCNRKTNDFDYDYDAIRTAVVRGLSCRSRKLH